VENQRLIGEKSESRNEASIRTRASNHRTIANMPESSFEIIRRCCIDKLSYTIVNLQGEKETVFLDKPNYTNILNFASSSLEVQNKVVDEFFSCIRKELKINFNSILNEAQSYFNKNSKSMSSGNVKSISYSAKFKSQMHPGLSNSFISMSPFKNKLGSFSLAPSLQFPNFGANLNFNMNSPHFRPSGNSSPSFPSPSNYQNLNRNISLSNLTSSFLPVNLQFEQSPDQISSSYNKMASELRSITPTSVQTLEPLTPRSTIYRNIPLSSIGTVSSASSVGLATNDTVNNRLRANQTNSLLRSQSFDFGDNLGNNDRDFSDINLSVGNDSQLERELLNMNIPVSSSALGTAPNNSFVSSSQSINIEEMRESGIYCILLIFNLLISCK